MATIKEALEELQFKAYELLSADIKHQLSFIDDVYTFDFEHLEMSLKRMKKIQSLICSIETSGENPPEVQSCDNCENLDICPKWIITKNNGLHCNSYKKYIKQNNK